MMETAKMYILQPSMPSHPLPLPYLWQPTRYKAITTCQRPPRLVKKLERTCLSSSSSSFHLAPRSLPTSPMMRILENEKDWKKHWHTETSIWVLSLDSFPPILTEKHVRGKSTFGSTLGLGGLSLGGLTLCGLALWTRLASRSMTMTK